MKNKCSSVQTAIHNTFTMEGPISNVSQNTFKQRKIQLVNQQANNNLKRKVDTESDNEIAIYFVDKTCHIHCLKVDIKMKPINFEAATGSVVNLISEAIYFKKL